MGWFKSTPEYRTLDRIDSEPMEFEWHIFPGFNTLQLSQEVQELLLRLNETPENFYRKDYLHVDVQRHLMGIKRQQSRMRVKCSNRFSICKKNWSRTMVISRSWFREKVVFYQCRKRTPSLSSHESIVKSKGGGKLSILYCADQDTVTTVFRTITSVNQLSLYGAVAEMCE